MRSEAQRDGGVLILVIEPDPYIRALELALLSTSYSVRFVADGSAAIEAARGLRPCLLIADILVPKVDGLRVCRVLKEDPATRGIPVLIFTELLAERRAKEAGADAFLRKPVDEARFLREVQRLLDTSAEQGES